MTQGRIICQKKRMLCDSIVKKKGNFYQIYTEQVIVLYLFLKSVVFNRTVTFAEAFLILLKMFPNLLSLNLIDFG